MYRPERRKVLQRFLPGCRIARGGNRLPVRSSRLPANLGRQTGLRLEEVLAKCDASDALELWSADSACPSGPLSWRDLSLRARSYTGIAIRHRHSDSRTAQGGGVPRQRVVTFAGLAGSMARGIASGSKRRRVEGKSIFKTLTRKTSISSSWISRSTASTSVALVCS